MDVADVEGIIAAGPDWADEVRKTAPEEFTEWIDATISGVGGDPIRGRAAQASDRRT